MTIYVSFPQSPSDYENKSCTLSWAQISYFVYTGLKDRFENVVYSPHMQPINLSGKDMLVTQSLNPDVRKWRERTVVVDNDNFDVNKWKYGKFTKYGLNKPTPHTYIFNHIFPGLYGAVIKTNDVAIAKWKGDHPDILEKKQFFLSNIKNFRFAPHPIDKQFFSTNYNKDLKLTKPKMLIYNSGNLKNANELIHTLTDQYGFFIDKFDVVNHIEKTTSPEHVKKYTYFAHVSCSEGFPYLANELLCQGILLYGHEEWWEPYGHGILKYTYDPVRNEQNIANLRRLLSDDFLEEYYLLRNDIVSKHLSRKDNDWGYFMNIVYELIDGLD
jgi:hypothetical protein